MNLLVKQPVHDFSDSSGEPDRFFVLSCKLKKIQLGWTQDCRYLMVLYCSRLPIWFLNLFSIFPCANPFLSFSVGVVARQWELLERRGVTGWQCINPTTFILHNEQLKPKAVWTGPWFQSSHVGYWPHLSHLIYSFCVNKPNVRNCVWKCIFWLTGSIIWSFKSFMSFL